MPPKLLLQLVQIPNTNICIIIIIRKSQHQSNQKSVIGYQILDVLVDTFFNLKHT